MSEPKNVGYHYATLPTLEKILASHVLRFSDVRFLNDRGEYLFAIEKFREWLVTERKLSEEDADFRVKQLRSELDSRPIYVASLSRDPDNAAMWQTYGGKSPAVAIGFDLSGWATEDAHVKGRRVREVIYAAGPQSLNQLDVQFFDSWLSDNTKFEHWLAYNELAAIKAPAFASEKEVRLTSTKGQPSYFERDGLLIPYVEDSFGDPHGHSSMHTEISTGTDLEIVKSCRKQLLPIVDVVIGPYGEQALAQIACEDLLSDFDHELRLSKVEMR